ncbi:MAG: Crp/Fnr family transcriptional regulator [Thermodesulfobacteriota bacterium]
MVDTDILRQVEVFQDLGFAQLKAVAEHCEARDLSAGERIFSEGDEPVSLYAVLEGEVVLHWGLAPGRPALEGRTVTTLGKHRTFGWSSLVPPRKFSLSAECAGTGCRVIRVDREGLLDLFEKDPEIGYLVMFRVLEVVSARFLALQEEVARRRGSDIINRW